MGILQSPRSVHTLRYLLLNHWTKSNQIWCVCYSHEWGVQRPWGGAKRSNIIKYHSISITKSISKIFKANFVRLLTNEKSKTYQTGFSYGRLGHASGVGLGVLWGVGGQKKFPKIDQSGCMSYLHEWHMQQQKFWVPRPLGPWGGAKGQILFNLNY